MPRGQRETAPRVFSYQATVSSPYEADRTSTSPSPSTSPQRPDWPRRPVVRDQLRRLPKLPAPSVFSYQAILSSCQGGGEDVHISVPVHVRREDRAGIVRRRGLDQGCWVCSKLPGPRPSFAYQAISSSLSATQRAHPRSPSPSTSAAKTEIAPSAAVEITCGLPKLPAPSVFSYQAILSSFTRRPRGRPRPRPRRRPPRRPKRPSPPPWRSPAAGRSCPPRPCSHTRRSCRRSLRGGEDVHVPIPVHVRREDRDGINRPAAVEITCWLPKLPAPSVFSYQAILSSVR